MAWADAFFGGYAIIQCAGVALPQEKTVNFVNATGTDNPSAGVTNVTISATVAPGSAGQAYFTNAGGTAGVWVNLTQDAVNNAAVPGQVTVQGILTKPIPSLPVANSALVYTGSAFVWTSTSSFGSTVTWANDLAGSTNTSQTVVQISGAAPVEVVNGALSFGSTVASGGALRFASTQAIRSRNFGNTADLSLIVTDTSDEIIFGDFVNTATYVRSLSQVNIQTPNYFVDLLDASGKFSLGVQTLAFVNTAAAPLFTQDQVTGTGVTTSAAFTIRAQQGRNVASGTNNVGGSLYLSSGLAGTGGTGGSPGDVLIQAGSNTWMQIGPQAGGFYLIGANLMFWATAIVNPTFYQLAYSGTGASNGNPFSISAQGGQNQTGANANNSGGYIVLTPGTPGTGGSGAAGAYGGVSVNTSTWRAAIIGDYGIVPANSPQTYGAIWFALGSGALPNATNWGFLGSQSQTFLNVASGGIVYIAYNGSSSIACAWNGATFYPTLDNTYSTGSTGNRWSAVNAVLFSSFANQSDANSAVQINPASGLLFGAGGASALDTRIRRTAAGVLDVDNGSGGDATFNVGNVGSTQQISIVSSVSTIKIAGVANPTGANLTLQPQFSQQSGTTTPGNLIVNIGAPSGSGTEAYFQIQRGNTSPAIVATIGPLPGSGTLGSVLCLIPATAATATNYSIAGASTQTAINAPNTGTLLFQNGGSTILTLTSSNQLQIQNGIVTFTYGWTAAATGTGGTLAIQSQNGGGVSGSGGQVIIYPGRPTNSSSVLFANAALEQFQITSNSGGNTSNTQGNTLVRRWANVRLTTTSTTNVDSYTLNSSGNQFQALGVHVRVLARATTAGISGGFTAVGQCLYSEFIGYAYDVGGTVTIGTFSQLGTAVSLAVSCSASGNTVNLGISSSAIAGGAVVDCQVYTEWFVC